MSAPAKALIGIYRFSPVLVAKDDYVDVKITHEAIDDRLGVNRETSLEHNRRLRQRGSAHPNEVGAAELFHDLLGTLLLQDDRDDRRRIEDQTPSLPKPRISSSSSRPNRFPSTPARRAFGQTLCRR